MNPAASTRVEAQSNRCRSCGSDQQRSLGPIPPASSFAGAITPIAAIPSTLIRCNHCFLVYRTPVLDEEGYASLYGGDADTAWTNQTGRNDWSLARDAIEDRIPLGGSVLDVGCSTGGFLRTLKDRFECFGVEPNNSAANEARGFSKGVWGSVESIPDAARFDALVLTDVIEHVIDPAVYLDQLLKLLNVGGILVITTGNPEAPLWRLLRGRFWYCYYPEHISFIGDRWISSFAGRRSLDVGTARAFRHKPMTNASILAELVGCLLFWISPSGFFRLRSLLTSRPKENTVPPGAGASRDHMIFVLQKGERSHAS